MIKMIKDQLTKGEIIAKRDEVTYLFSYGNNQASILHLEARVLSTPMHPDSFLKLGYWEDYTGGVDLEAVIPTLRLETESGELVVINKPNTDRQCFVFRQSPNDQKALFTEIEKGRLRQGWSFAEGLSLLNGKDQFIQAFEQATAQWDAVKQWGTLSRMLNIKPGDYIVVPKQPDSKHFTIMQAKLREDGLGCYDFIEPLKGRNDYRHVIHVDPASVQVVHYEAMYPAVIKRLLKSIAYSSPVNVVRQKGFKEAIHTLMIESEKTELKQAHPLQAKMKEVEKRLYQEWVEEARNLTPSDFEKVVKSFMEANGFTIKRANQYDRLGGDIDLKCSKEVPLHTPFEPSMMEVTYYIQVKKHKGITGATGVKQLNQMVDHLPRENGKHVQKILLSLADDFSEDCKVLAEESEVLLIDGGTFAEMYVKSGE
jgi:restriction endonuclease Mrr